MYIPFDELRSVFEKVDVSDSEHMGLIISPTCEYKLTEQALIDYPELEDIQSNGHVFDITSNAFALLDDILYFEEPQTEQSIEILGTKDRERTYRWIDRKYVDAPSSLEQYKVIVSKAFGRGVLDDSFPQSVIGGILVGCTQSFLTFGGFDTQTEAEACLKYIKTKFARALLYILKRTQNMTSGSWRYVPLQDFTPQSDIDWTQSVADIDQQLYKKYGLTEKEIDFIETKVRPMT